MSEVKKESESAVQAGRLARCLVEDGGMAQEYAFDPILLLALASFIVGVIRLALECSRNRRGLASRLINDPGPVARLVLRRRIRLAIEDDPRLSRVSPVDLRQAFYKSLPIGEEELASLFNEAEASRSVPKDPVPLVVVPLSLLTQTAWHVVYSDDQEIKEDLEDFLGDFEIGGVGGFDISVDEGEDDKQQ